LATHTQATATPVCNVINTIGQFMKALEHATADGYLSVRLSHSWSTPKRFNTSKCRWTIS